MFCLDEIFKVSGLPHIYIYIPVSLSITNMLSLSHLSDSKHAV